MHLRLTMGMTNYLMVFMHFMEIIIFTDFIAKIEINLEVVQ
jgi:hypothetical protein